MLYLVPSTYTHYFPSKKNKNSIGRINFIKDFQQLYIIIS